jgi:hypothetical protein
MSHDEHNTHASGASRARLAVLDDGRLPQAAALASDTDAELSALRRSLLLYGTAGQEARLQRGVQA